jgi:hypothetical protein
MDDWIVNMGWMDLEWKSWGRMGCEGKKDASAKSYLELKLKVGSSLW